MEEILLVISCAVLNIFLKSSDRTIKGIYTEIFSYSIKFINSVTASKIVKLHQKYLDISGDLINRKQIKKPPEKFVDSTMEALRREADKNFERLMKG